MLKICLLLSYFTDADIAKMDVLKSPKRRKPAQVKVDGGKNTKAKPSARKVGAKISVSPSKISKTEKPLKSALKKTAKKMKDKRSHSEPQAAEVPVNKMTNNLPENDMPLKKIKNKKKANQSDSNTGTPTKSVGAQKLDNLSEPKQVEAPSKKTKSKVKNKPLEPTGTDTPLKTDTEAASTLLTSEEPKRTDRKPREKKAKSKKSVEPPEPVDVDTPPKTAGTEVASRDLQFDQSENNDELSDPKLVKMPSKKVKKSVHFTETVGVNTSSAEAEGDQSEINNKLSHPELAETTSKKSKSKKSSKADAEVGSRHGTSDKSETPKKDKAKKSDDILSPTQVETPSKKTKAKKTREPPEAVDVNSPPEGGQDVNDPDSLSKKPTSENEKSVQEPDPSKKGKVKKTKSISELSETETPSNANSEELHSEPPAKKAKSQTANSLSEAPVSEKPSKKSKNKKSLENDEAESPSNEACLDDGGVDQTMCPSKKSKSKKSDSQRNSETITDADQNIESEETGCLSTPQQRGEKKRKHKDEDSTCDLAQEEGPVESKKKRKKKKARDENVIEEVPAAPLSEELTDTLEISPEKKSKPFFLVMM